MATMSRSKKKHVESPEQLALPLDMTNNPQPNGIPVPDRGGQQLFSFDGTTTEKPSPQKLAEIAGADQTPQPLEPTQNPPAVIMAEGAAPIAQQPPFFLPENLGIGGLKAWLDTLSPQQKEAQP
jgi:hypothetical protein